jgi:hypothetical protein
MFYHLSELIFLVAAYFPIYLVGEFMRFEELEPKEVYLYYDAPLIFSVEVEGKLFLGYSWDIDRIKNQETLMFFQTTPQDLEELKKQTVSIRDFIQKNCDNKKANLVIYQSDGSQLSCENGVEFSQIQADCPKSGIFLNYVPEPKISKST